MSIRTVRYNIYPAASRPPTIPSGDDLTFDVADIAAPAMQEILRTAAGAVSLHAMLEELLVPQAQNADPLIWLEDGVGVGIEMKRGFSGILGRFFARWYLQNHHQLTNFVPINGEGTIVSLNVIVRRTGQVHLPDWICLDQNGRPVLAESKASHSKSTSWAGSTANGPLQKAREQLENAIIQIRSPQTGQLRRVSTKGWAVLSRWGTVENHCDPLLYALDPTTKGNPLTQSEAQQAAQDIRKAALEGYMRVLGHPDLADRLATARVASDDEAMKLQDESDEAEYRWASEQGATLPLSESKVIPSKLIDARRLPLRTRSIRMEAVRIDDEQLADRQFIGGIVDQTGRLIATNVSDIIQGRSAGPATIFRNFYFAGFDVNTLTAALSGAPAPALSRYRGDIPASEATLPTLSVLADGFAFAPLEILSNHVGLPPDELTEPGHITRP